MPHGPMPPSQFIITKRHKNDMWVVKKGISTQVYVLADTHDDFVQCCVGYDAHVRDCIHIKNASNMPTDSYTLLVDNTAYTDTAKSNRIAVLKKITAR